MKNGKGKIWVTPYQMRNYFILEDFKIWLVDHNFDVFSKCERFEVRAVKSNRVAILYKNNVCNREFLALCRNFLTNERKIKFKVH